MYYLSIPIKLKYLDLESDRDPFRFFFSRFFKIIFLTSYRGNSPCRLIPRFRPVGIVCRGELSKISSSLNRSMTRRSSLCRLFERFERFLASLLFDIREETRSGEEESDLDFLPFDRVGPDLLLLMSESRRGRFSRAVWPAIWLISPSSKSLLKTLTFSIKMYSINRQEKNRQTRISSLINNLTVHNTMYLMK